MEDFLSDDDDDMSYERERRARDMKRMEKSLNTIGFQDGLTDVEDAVAQKSFNEGFSRAAVVSSKMQILRGILSTVLLMPSAFGLSENDEENEVRALLKKIETTTDGEIFLVFETHHSHIFIFYFFVAERDGCLQSLFTECTEMLKRIGCSDMCDELNLRWQS